MGTWNATCMPGIQSFMPCSKKGPQGSGVTKSLCVSLAGRPSKNRGSWGNIGESMFYLVQALSSIGSCTLDLFEGWQSLAVLKLFLLSWSIIYTHVTHMYIFFLWPEPPSFLFEGWKDHLATLAKRRPKSIINGLYCKYFPVLFCRHLEEPWCETKDSVDSLQSMSSTWFEQQVD